MEDNEAGPAAVKTPDFMNIKKVFNIFLSNNNKSEYTLNIELDNDKILLFLKEKNDYLFKYVKNYTLEEIKKLSNIFGFYDNMGDIYNYLIEMLENKQLILKYDEMLNVPYLSFFFEIPHAKKTEEVKLVLELDKKVLNQKEGNDFILKEINELKKEVKELKEENKNLKIIIEKNKENSNDAIKENLEAIINVLIDEKLKEKNDNKNNENRSNISNNTNINNNNENELKNLNELITILNNDHNDEIKKIKENIKDINTRLHNIENKDLTNIKQEIESITGLINNINNIKQEDYQKANININEIKNDLNSFKKTQEDTIKTLNLIINSTNDTVENYRFIINDLNNYNGSIGNNNIRKENTISKLINIIKNKSTEYQNNNIQLKLLYDAGRDGRMCTDCHSKCNNVPNTLSLVTTTKGRKFGFFRSIAINGNGLWKNDNKAFFISLDKEKIYKIKSDKTAVKFDDTFFINTPDFSLSGNILTDKFICADKNSMNNNFDGFTEEYELTCGEKDFYIKKFEVYQLEFSN